MPKVAKSSPSTLPAAVDFHQLARPALEALWETTFKRPLSPKMRRPLAAQLLRFHQQDAAYGGLPPEVEAYLASLLPKSRGRGPQAPSTPLRRLKPGTRLLRTWRGQIYTVIVADPGFVYEGTTYNSLSVIAREITGTAWSGPVFFGLKKTKPTERTA